MPIKSVISSGVLLHVLQLARAGSFISGGSVGRAGALVWPDTKRGKILTVKIARQAVRVLIAFGVCFHIFCLIVQV